MQIRDAGLDDLGLHLSRLRVPRYTDAGRVAGFREDVADLRGQGGVFMGREGVERVDLVSVGVLQFYAGGGVGGLGGVVGFRDEVVEEGVVGGVLGEGHDTLEADVVVFGEGGLGCDGEAEALVGGLVDDGADFGFDLEGAFDGGGFGDGGRLEGVVVDDLLEEEVADFVLEVVVGGRVTVDAFFEVAEWSVGGTVWLRGSWWSRCSIGYDVVVDVVDGWLRRCLLLLLVLGKQSYI